MIIHFSIFTISLTLLIWMDSCKQTTGKCIIEKESVNCFGSTWKEDLLPIENDSLQKLNISKCSTSSSYSTSFEISFIKNLVKLKLISITECKLKKPPVIQDSITSIEIINLSNNLIDEQSQYDALGMNFFKRLPNLKVIDLSKNRLKDLPVSWFDCSNHLEILILNDNLISGLDPYLASCMSQLKQLYLRNNQFTILKKPSEFKVSLASFDVGAMGLEISKRAKWIQPEKTPGNIRHKTFKRPSNKKNHNHMMPQFKSLEHLDLAYNKIHSLDQIPLLDLKKLSTLNLRGNHLSTYSDIMDNKCDFGTAPFYINGKFGLTQLDLSENSGLSRINTCWTFGLQNLQVLEISNCTINTISDQAFEKMKKLSKLDLSRNQLNEVPKELITVASTLLYLNMAYNNISQLRSTSLIRLENLRTLNLSHNQFQNFLTFSTTDFESKTQDLLINIPPSNDSPELEEPVGILSRMRHLRDLDVSFNNLLKISATADLPPSIRYNGVMWRINLVGNSQLSQLVDFNYEEITPMLSNFVISDQLKLNCSCNLMGFVKWITHRQIKVTAYCGSPDHLAGQSITSNQVLKSLMINKNCDDKVTHTKPMNPIYRLKISSNANRTADNLVDSGPMNNNMKKSSFYNKRPNDFQKWAMIASNLTFACEFYSSHQSFFVPTIEWQRMKLVPSENMRLNTDQNQPNNYLFLKTDNLESLDTSKFQAKVDVLNSQYDIRMKTVQIGPLDEKLDLEKFGFQTNIELIQNRTIKFSDRPYKYISYLTIQSIYMADFGRYRCVINDLPINQFYGQSQLYSKEEEIKVFIPPKFTATPSNTMSIIEDETAEITCRAEGYPLPLTSLGRIGSKEFPAAQGQRMVIFKDDSSFFITKIRQVDAGNYSCTSRNPAGIISYNFTLKVQIPATFVERAPSKMTIQAGQPLIIRFKINGVPTPTIRWSKDNQNIVGNDRISFSADHLMFVVQSSILDDAGSYKISILNALGGNEATVDVRILDNYGISHGGIPINDKPSIQTPSNLRPDSPKEPNWISDYWLSAIIIIVVLSILLTSILWITIFLCFSKFVRSKKHRLLLISNSQSKSSFDKCLTSTTNFSNTRNNLTSNVCHIPLSMTTSTIVRHDQSREECRDMADSDLVIDSLKSCSEFYSPQISRSCFPELQSTYSINNNHLFHSQPYLTTSKIDLSNCLNQISTKPHQKIHLKSEPCDSGIDSSHIYSETLNSSDISSIYKCRHKSKHKINNGKRKRHQNATGNESTDVLKSTPDVFKTQVISDSNHVDSDKNAQVIGRDYLLKQSKGKKSCNAPKNCSTPLIDSNFALQCG